jgi:hypothetical protein
MTPIQIVAVCLRLLAVIWFLYILGHTYTLMSVWRVGSAEVMDRAFLWFTIGLQLIICVLLWFFPATIARKLLPAAADSGETRSPVALVEWQTLGVICIGVWALTRAVPDVFYWVTFYAMSISANYGDYDVPLDQKAGIFSTLAELAVGFWLVFGAKGFAALLFKIRTGGVSK